MKIKELNVVHLPGFENGGPKYRDFSPSINVVYGRNASGKSTTARTIRALLWPDSAKITAGDIATSEWATSDGDHHLEIARGAVTCRPQLPPILPDKALARCYTVTVDDLFDDAGGDLAAQAARDIAGGFDLARTRDECGFGDPKNLGKGEHKLLLECDKKFSDIKAKQAGIAADENRLDDLKAQKEGAERERERKGVIQRAIELAGHKERLASAEVELSVFDSGMELLDGKEEAKLAEIREDIDRSENLLAESERVAEEASRELSGIGLENKTPDGTAVEEHIERARSLRALEDRLSSAKLELASDEARLKTAADALSSFGSTERIAALKVADLEAIEKLYRREMELATELSQIDVECKTLKISDTVRPMIRLVEGTALLRKWLRQPGPASVTRDPLRIVAAAGAFIAAVIAMIVAASGAPLAWIAAFAALVGGFFSLRKVRSDALDYRTQVQQDFNKLGLCDIPSWDARKVEEALDQLETELLEARDLEARTMRRDKMLVEKTRLENDRDELAKEWREERERIGVGLEQASDLTFVQVVERLLAFRKANDEAAARCAVIEELTGSSRGLLEAINAFVGDFGYEHCVDSNEAALRLSDLQARMNKRKGFLKDTQNAEDKIRSCREEIARGQHRMKALFQEAGIEENDDLTLRERSRRLDEYKIASKEVGELRTRIAVLSKQIESEPELAELTRARLEELLRQSEESAASLESFIKQINDIKRDVEAASQSRELESALAEKIRLTEELKARREQAFLAAAGGFLLDDLETEFRRKTQPIVVNKADELFQEFTNRQYRMEIEYAGAGSAAPDFLARETSTGRAKKIEELSRGTRMQLLLAARIAFACVSERGEKLPLLLDEALNSTDPERFRAVANSLLALANDGRQIIYFTCHQGDVKAWKDLAAESGFGDPRFFNLDAGSDANGPRIVSSAQASDVPDPGDSTLDEYAAMLGVPLFDPSRALGETHLYYFLDDAHQLYNLLHLGIRSWGQAEALLKKDATVYFPAGAAEKMRARARVLDLLAEAWNTGRGKPVDYEALVQAGVSANFLDRIADLATKYQGDAARILAAIENGEVKRFRDDALESLKTFFAEHGHLDERQHLTRDQVYERVLSGMAEDVRRERITAIEIKALFDRSAPSAS